MRLWLLGAAAANVSLPEIVRLWPGDLTATAVFVMSVSGTAITCVPAAVMLIEEPESLNEPVKGSRASGSELTDTLRELAVRRAGH
jgi:hypothetical protein